MISDKPLALTMGDPAGCGPQITAAAWHDRKDKTLKPFFVVGHTSLYQSYCPVTEITDPAMAMDIFDHALPVLQLPDWPSVPVIAGWPDHALVPAITKSIEQTVAITLAGDAAAMTTCPISKTLLYETGFKHAGHTEFIAELCHPPGTGKSALPVMMLVGGGLKIALATIHIPLMQVAAHITADRLETVALTVDAALRRDFAISSPKIAFAGLNPHAGEQGTIGREECDIINPVARSLRKRDVKISDARPADSVFHEARTGQFDAVIAMTHDQGLIPVKTLDFWGGVNTTTGLPVIRTSPDHGTAYTAASTGACRQDSLIAALLLAEQMASNRARFDG